MLFRVLGSLEVMTGDGLVVTPRGTRARALLTALLLRPGDLVPTSRLAEAVWGESPPVNADNALHVVVGRVRRALGPAGGRLLVTGSAGYRLDVTSARVDAEEFESDCRAARSTEDPAAAVAGFDRALGRWRGPAYGEFAASFARSAAVRLEELRRTAAEDRAEALLRSGSWDDAVASASGLVHEYPLAERPVLTLMRALAEAGRIPDALQAYQHHAQELQEQLGLDPGSRTRELQSRILREEVGREVGRGTPPVEPASVRSPVDGQVPAAPVGPDGPAVSVPGQPSGVRTPEQLWGREDDVAALRVALDESRLVTVAGVGGVGKTAVAAAVTAGMPGVVTCELAAVVREDEVGATVAVALGFGSLPAAAAGLGDASRLVVVDNCEHVLDAAAAVVNLLIDQCPCVVVLATSREPLDLPAERVYRLDPLRLPEGNRPDQVGESPAGRLLLARAEAVGSRIVLEPHTAAAVSELCHRLDGLPLALELAAARTRSLTPAEILTHLDHRLDLLARPRNRGPARHRSLETAIGWSYDRLPAQVREFFDRLGIFPSRFTVEQAHAVAGEPGGQLLDTVGRLDHLVGRSLLTVRQDAGRSTYGLLDTLRAFAMARLAERGELDRSTDRWVEQLAEWAGQARWGAVLPGGVTWAATSHAVHADLLEAARWCADHDDRPDRVLRLIRPLAGMVYSARAAPVAELAEQLLERWTPDPGRPSAPASGRGDLAAVAAFAHMATRSVPRATSLARSVLEAEPTPFAAVLALRTLYLADLLGGRPREALRWAEQAIAVAVAGGEQGWASEMRTLRAGALVLLGRADEARRQADEAHDDAAALGSVTLQLWADLARASLLSLDDRQAGASALTDLVDRCRSVDYQLVEGACYWSLAGIALVAHRPVEAARWLSPALELFVRNDTTPLRVTLRWIAVAAGALGRAEAGRALHRAAGSASTLAIVERMWLDRLAGPPVGAGDPPVALATAVSIARRELTAMLEETDDRVAGAATGPRFERDGAVWTVSFAARTVRLPDAKGMHDLATLLARPGREVHCTELVDARVYQPDAGELLDPQARRGYEARIRELQDDLQAAEDDGDRGRAERARWELDILVEQLATACGLGGRRRRPSSTAERARSAATWRIRAAVRRIAGVHPELGTHLLATIRTGFWCSYVPVEDTRLLGERDDAACDRAHPGPVG